MTLVLGVGQAGCNLAAEMARVPHARDFLDVYLCNSTVRDLVHIGDVPRSRWIGINEQEGLVPLAGVGGQEEREVQGGMGKDPRRCFTALSAVLDPMVGALERLEGVASERFALLLFSGGGGTGAGAAPVVARALREATDGQARILGALVLPAQRRGRDAAAAGTLREAWNAWFSLQQSLDAFDGLVLVDNERLSHVGDIERAFPRFNQYVARCLTDMVLGNLTELELPKPEGVVLQQSDVADLTTALSVAQPGERRAGVAAIGRAVQLLQGPAGYVLPFLPPRTPDLGGLSLEARERLTLDAGGAPYEKAYVLVRAPARVLERPGLGRDVGEVLRLAAQGSRRNEVIYGTALTKRPLASVTLGLTFDPREVPRLQALEGDAVQYEWEVESHPRA